jgi:hypothetical protein
VALLVALLVPVACDRRPASPPPDSAAVRGDSATQPGPGPAAVSPWRADAGPVLVVRDEASAARATVVFPEYTDSTLTDTTTFATHRLAGAQADLFGRSGLVSPAAALGPAAADVAPVGCTAWPPASVAADGGQAPPPWTVAFLTGRARPMPLDSLAGMKTRDSARFAVDVARLANALPSDGDGDFHGLPYVVRAAYRFTPDSGTEALVAMVMRRVSREADPRVQHVLLVGERSAGGKWALAFSERSTGAEETLELTEVLAAVQLGSPPRPTLVLARDYGDGMAYALLERVGVRDWRVRWSSAYAGC